MRNKRLLIVAYHFPPLQGSSGLHRSLSLARYLPAAGWDVSVLTVAPKTYRKIHPDNDRLIPESTHVIRAPAFDSSRTLRIFGWYPGFLAKPDNFQSWIVSGAIAGYRHCRRFPPDVILSTFPIASAHYLGWLLQRWTKTPWVIDFRDPMAQDDYPSDLRKRALLHKLERKFVRAARAVMVTTPGAHRQYVARYAKLNVDNAHVVPNGYEESMFAGYAAPTSVSPDRVTILHSGNVYKSERDPTQLFDALALLLNEDPGIASRLRVLFRGTQQSDYYLAMVEKRSLESMVEFGAAVPYQEATREMLSVDGLLILQASNCNDQIPAKVYEYLRSGRPIIALTDASGDTAGLLRRCGISAMADLNDTQAIAACLRQFLSGDLCGYQAHENFDVTAYSRESIAGRVDSILTNIVGPDARR